MARTLTVYLAADVKKFKKGMDDAGDSTHGLKGRVSGLGDTIKSNLGPALATAGLAVGALAVKLGVDGVQAAIADQQEVTKLTTVMKNLGLAMDTAPALAQIDALQRMSGVSESELRPSFTRLVTSLGDTDKAMTALKLAMDIATATGKPLETVTAALGKAYDGNTGALGRLGVGLDKATLKSGNLDEITGILTTRFGGSAAANAATYQGKINQLTVGFDELKEAFGEGFLSSLGSAESGLGSITGLMAENEPTVKEMGESIGVMATQLMDVAGMAMDAKTGFDQFMDGLGPAGTAIDEFVTQGAPLINFLNSAQNAAQAAANAIERLLGLREDWESGPKTFTSTGGGNFSNTAPNYAPGGHAPAGGTSVVFDPISTTRALTAIQATARGRTGG